MMKERELRQHATRTLCRKPIGHTGIPLFWRVTVERFGLDLNAIRRQQGLGMMIGRPLAHIMGPDEDMASPMMEPAVLTVCESCGSGQSLPVAAFAEFAPAKEATEPA